MLGSITLKIYNWIAINCSNFNFPLVIATKKSLFRETKNISTCSLQQETKQNYFLNEARGQPLHRNSIQQPRKHQFVSPEVAISKIGNRTSISDIHQWYVSLCCSYTYLQKYTIIKTPFRSQVVIVRAVNVCN